MGSTLSDSTLCHIKHFSIHNQVFTVLYFFYGSTWQGLTGLSVGQQ